MLLIIFLIFGAKRLPDMGRGLGGGLRGFGKAIQGDDEEPKATIDQPRETGEGESSTSASGRAAS